MTELERQGLKADPSSTQRDESGKLQPVKLQDPHPDKAVGWSPSEWRRRDESEETGE